MVKIFTPNKNGKIEFTKKELEELLNEVWRDGYNSNHYWTWYSPWSYSGTYTIPVDYANVDSSVTITKSDDHITYTGDSIKLNIGE